MVCPGCTRPVLVAIVGGQTVIAELYEWQPRSRCFPCAGAQATSKKGRVHCSRCGGSGFIGEWRPKEPLLAIDVAWGDEPHLRIISPGVARRRGEALHRLHSCGDVPTPRLRER
jgi:hypothetical protein